MAQSPDTLARSASNNMPLSEQDAHELRELFYLRVEGTERQERLQYLRQTWKSSIWSQEYDGSYTLPDPEVPLVYSLHYGQQGRPVGDGRSWQEPPLAAAPQEHRPWLLRSSDPGVLLRSTDPGS